MRTAVVMAVKEQVPGVQRPELRVMPWAEKPRALMGNSGRKAGQRAGTLSRGAGEPQSVSRGGVRPALGVERPICGPAGMDTNREKVRGWKRRSEQGPAGGDGEGGGCRTDRAGGGREREAGSGL